jgi:hypothetical protein
MQSRACTELHLREYKNNMKVNVGLTMTETGQKAFLLSANQSMNKQERGQTAVGVCDTLTAAGSLCCSDKLKFNVVYAC